jgi:hypothetical protein
MFKRILEAWLRRYGGWLLVQAGLGLAVLVLAVLTGVEAALPARAGDGPPAALTAGEAASAEDWLHELPAPEKAAGRVTAALRPGLFKSATPLADKPMADKTIEKILAQLKLRCIVQINGQPVAYINVENGGLKRCRAGDSVANLFTVVRIHEKSVDLTIVGHPVTLSL